MRRTATSVGLVFPVMAAIGSVLGQSVVLRFGFRPVAAAGMALMSGGALLLTQVSVGGSYVGDIFFGLLVFGPGVGLAFVTASIAALAGVPERDSGLASGLLYARASTCKGAAHRALVRSGEGANRIPHTRGGGTRERGTPYAPVVDPRRAPRNERVPIPLRTPGVSGSSGSSSSVCSPTVWRSRVVVRR